MPPSSSDLSTTDIDVSMAERSDQATADRSQSPHRPPYKTRLIRREPDPSNPEHVVLLQVCPLSLCPSPGTNGNFHPDGQPCHLLLVCWGFNKPGGCKFGDQCNRVHIKFSCRYSMRQGSCTKADDKNHLYEHRSNIAERRWLYSWLKSHEINPALPLNMIKTKIPIYNSKIPANFSVRPVQQPLPTLPTTSFPSSNRYASLPASHAPGSFKSYPFFPQQPRLDQTPIWGQGFWEPILESRMLEAQRNRVETFKALWNGQGELIWAGWCKGSGPSEGVALRWRHTGLSASMMSYSFFPMQPRLDQIPVFGQGFWEPLLESRMLELQRSRVEVFKALWTEQGELVWCGWCEAPGPAEGVALAWRRAG